jgi:D-tyrosyl-tRNA(Tyr) deacylase
MRAVLQRVHGASVTIDGSIVSRIERGLLVFVGIAAGDGPADIAYVASKVRDVRVFADDLGRMNRSVQEVGGAVLVVSQFTLMADARRGRRPSFDAAAAPEDARRTYDALLIELKRSGVALQSGVFQADMQVELINDGPVTVLLDSRRVL